MVYFDTSLILICLNEINNLMNMFNRIDAVKVEIIYEPSPKSDIISYIFYTIKESKPGNRNIYRIIF